MQKTPAVIPPPTKTPTILLCATRSDSFDPNVALRFIFSHSALREGWDNPNVFQICTLNETQSTEKKRQEIGRGLRLPVNETGERVHDETVNRLTVVANESYEDFARTLQTEFEDDFGIRFGKVERIAFARLVRIGDDGTEAEIGQEESARIWTDLVREGYLSEAGDILDKFDPRNPHFELKVSYDFADLKAEIIDEINRKVFKNRVVNARERRELRFRKKVQLSPNFQELWERIKQRTRYRVTFDTAELIERALLRIRRIEPIRPPRVATTVVEVDISEAGVSADRQIATRVRHVEAIKVLPDILAFLQKETELNPAHAGQNPQAVGQARRVQGQSAGVHGDRCQGDFPRPARPDVGRHQVREDRRHLLGANSYRTRGGGRHSPVPE